MTIDQFDEDALDVDPNNLDLNCVGHAKFMRVWGDKLAAARRNTREVKANLKLVVAEEKQTIRNTQFGPGGKPLGNEPVDELLQLNGRFQTAQQQVIQAEYEEELIESKVKAIESRGRTGLDNMVKLFGQQYFAPPRADPETRQRYESTANARRLVEQAEAAQDSKPAPKKPATKPPVRK